MKKSLQALSLSLAAGALLLSTQALADSKCSLKDGKIPEFLSIIQESGRSSAELLQNYYSPKAPEEQGISLACAIASDLLGSTGAWRVHGGGFAGTMQAFVPQEKLPIFVCSMETVFGKGSVTGLSVRPLGAVCVYHG